jgi:arylamine N-acetyltransferase
VKFLLDLTAQFLSFLKLTREKPTLNYLHRLVKQHQLLVPWETLSKMIDLEEEKNNELFLQSPETYIQRLVENGYGGTCWSQAVSFHYLLQDLGFDVSYIYMDPGHLCLRVDLNEVPYYIDVGYCAPIYKAYPLFQNFSASNDKEMFTYSVAENKQSILVERNPGPTKTLYPTPVTLKEMYPHIQKAGDWDTAFTLKEVKLFGYIDGNRTSITDYRLKQYVNGEKITKVLTEDERHFWVTEKFNMDAAMYDKAITIFNERTRKGCSH